MPGGAAVGKARLDAGNLGGAEREALALLERDPHDRDALELLISVALKRGDHATALAMSEEWVAREPDCLLAHHARILALAKAKKKRQARQALERYRADFPLDKAGYEAMWVAMETTFGNSDAAIRKIGGLRREHGDELPLDELDVVAKTKSGQLFGASRAADRVLAKDPLDSTALLMKATNAFRLMRFWTARRVARQLRQAAPERSAVANEIICASYAAYFPPFLVASLILIPIYLTISRSKIAVLLYYSLYIVALLLAGPFMTFVDYLAESTGIPGFQSIFYLSMFAWVFYNLLIFQRFSSRRRSAKTVQLSRNY